MARAAKTAKSTSPKKTAKSDTKATKKAKDPNAPKRNLSAYFIWMNESRASLTKPGMSVGDVAKAAGVEWKKIKDKSKWEKAAAEDKKRYEREMKAYKP